MERAAATPCLLTFIIHRPNRTPSLHIFEAPGPNALWRIVTAHLKKSPPLKNLGQVQKGETVVSGSGSGTAAEVIRSLASRAEHFAGKHHFTFGEVSN